jgi:hypothetical protein
MQTLHCAPARIENEFMAAGFDERTRTEPIHARRRRAGAQQCHTK